MSEEKKHALLSASASHKWLNCIPSARLEEKFESKTSEYAEEGTLAHEIAEFKVRSYFLEPLSKSTYTKRLNKFKKDERYKEDMLEATETYLEFIKGLAMQTAERPFIAVEVELDYSQFVPEGFGTSDCVLISDNTLHVIDYKHGKGVEVSAEENPQMKLYAVGAYLKYSCIYNIQLVKMHIVQPRIDNISSYQIPAEELTTWATEVVKPLAEKAWAGVGEFKQGEHCRFCRAKGACEFRAKENMKIYEEVKKSGILTNAELGDILLKTDGFEKWLKDLKEYALDTLLKGEEVPGWKAVEGKSNRKITDVDKAFAVLEQEGFEQALLYEKKPLSLTELESLVGKKKLPELIGTYIEKPKGAPTLAKEADKREKYSARTTAVEDFKEEREEK